MLSRVENEPNNNVSAVNFANKTFSNANLVDVLSCLQKQSWASETLWKNI